MKAMKVRNIFSALFVSLVAMVSCQQIEVNNHDDIRAPKQLNVLADEYNVGWEGETIDLSFTTNSFWGVEFLGWKDEIIQEGDTARVVVNAAWMSTPVIYGEGNATLQVKIAANDKSRRAREGYIKVFTGDENVCKMIPVVQSGNPDYEGPEGLPILDLYFDFTTNFMGWPTASQSTGEYVYPLDGVDYSFEFGRCNMSKYLVIHNQREDAKTITLNVDGTDLYHEEEVSAGEYTLEGYNSLILKYDSDTCPINEDDFQAEEQQEYTVTIRVTVPENTPDEPIYIIGTFDNWKVADEPYIMTKVGDYTYEYTLTGEAYSDIEYKYNRGNWDAREQNADHQDLVGPLQKENREYSFEEDGFVQEDVIESWSDVQ